MTTNQSSPALGPKDTTSRPAQTMPGCSYLEGIVTDYQRDCARRMRLAMRGNNRELAQAWAARCASLGEWRRT